MTRKWLWFSSRDFDHFYDTFIMDPLLKFADNYAHYFGPIFIGFLISMMGLVVVNLYLIILPYEYFRRPFLEFLLYMLIGHYFLINTIFHYYKACITKPGFPPQDSTSFHYVTQCKHCHFPKPVRTHHCSVCNRCILKMDHHCPWLNQCVGHFNHRYFYMTMFFMWAGCLVIVAGMWQCFINHFWCEETVMPWCSLLKDKLPYYARSVCKYDMETLKATLDKNQTSHKAKIGQSAYNCVVFEFFTTVAVVFGVGSMLVWHTILISNGETSIERLNNKDNTTKMKQMGKIYRNSYNYGFLINWKIFLGLGKGRTFFKHVILPSSHLPHGDGLAWPEFTELISRTSSGVVDDLHIV